MRVSAPSSAAASPAYSADPPGATPRARRSLVTCPTATKRMLRRRKRKRSRGRSGSGIVHVYVCVYVYAPDSERHRQSEIEVQADAEARLGGADLIDDR